MKYLGKPDGSLITMWVIARHISTNGPATVEELFEVLRPKKLTTGEGEALTSSTLIGEDLGIFGTGDEAQPLKCLTKALEDSSKWFDEFEGFASIARHQIVLQSERNVDERSDVGSAISWILSRDWRRGHDALADGIHSQESGVVGATQSAAFGRWCLELGVSNPGLGRAKHGLMPDPTSAIRHDLGSIKGRQLTAREFHGHLSSSIPTGPQHALLRGTDRGSGRPEDLELFGSVGYALLRLDHEGSIKMSISDDAKERIQFRFPGPGDEYRTVTHVEVSS